MSKGKPGGRTNSRLPGSPFPQVLSVILVVGAVWLSAWILSDPLPANQIRDARAALSVAEAAGARVYAPVEMEEASASWAQAVSLLDSSASGIWPYRQFDAVEVLTTRTVLLAGRARDAAERNADRMEADLENRRQYLSIQLDTLNLVARDYPPGAGIAVHLRTAERLGSQSLGAEQRGNARRADSLVSKAIQALARAETRHRGIQDSLDGEAELWRKRLQEVVAQSSGPIIAVDKRARRMQVVSPSGALKWYEIELGPEWMGDKMREGDKRTPEGLYHVSKKLGVGQTRYHRALLLDYPNREDRSRFAQNRERGLLQDSDRIGGLIEIHGGGGGRGPWTDGCIALPNTEMEQLFNRIPVGTPVLIAPAL